MSSKLEMIKEISELRDKLTACYKRIHEQDIALAVLRKSSPQESEIQHLAIDSLITMAKNLNERLERLVL